MASETAASRECKEVTQPQDSPIFVTYQKRHISLTRYVSKMTLQILILP
jgi:hypothetical protein